MLASKERHGCFQHVHTSDYLLRILTQLNYLLHSFWSLTEFSRITKRVPVLLTWKTITNRIKTISNLNKAVINDFLNRNIISLIAPLHYGNIFSFSFFKYITCRTSARINIVFQITEEYSKQYSLFNCPHYFKWSVFS